MAIVDGRRLQGLDILKMRGRKDWVLVDRRSGDYYGLPVAVDVKDPRKETFHYASGTAQLVFVDYFVGPFNRDLAVASSWEKMPTGWQKIFQRDVPYLFDKEFWK